MAKNKTNSGSQLNEGELTELSATPENTSSEVETDESPTEEHSRISVEKKTFKKQVVVSGAEFWEFSPKTEGADYDGPIFRGYYLNDVKREKDGKGEDQKAGSVIGFNFKQLETDLTFIIGNSHAIQKGLETCGFNTELLYEIEFLGKGITAAKQPYNRFEFSVLS